MSNSENCHHIVISVYVNNCYDNKYGFFDNVHMRTFIKDICNRYGMENQEKFVEIVFGYFDSKSFIYLFVEQFSPYASTFALHHSL